MIESQELFESAQRRAQAADVSDPTGTELMRRAEHICSFAIKFRNLIQSNVSSCGESVELFFVGVAAKRQKPLADHLSPSLVTAYTLVPSLYECLRTLDLRCQCAANVAQLAMEFEDLAFGCASTCQTRTS